ncbi:hypothetical protein Hypma_014668 [Hypsizygus marmoreus]|uniref:Anaphase-promoting complex subunit 4 WD40 domain-containing protein n=1 Tax=Hypsizygus marmoreus TaxID=39966 RepID=A0A369JGA2_HYPMA|nr:hypothetical protein Hypma_014668 [Hypsizygus marmoreus]
MAKLPTLKDCYDVPAYQGRIMNVIRLSPDGHYIASGDEEGMLVILKLPDLGIVRKFKAYDAIKCLAWHPNIPGALVAGAVNGDVVIIKADDVIMALLTLCWANQACPRPPETIFVLTMYQDAFISSPLV